MFSETKRINLNLSRVNKPFVILVLIVVSMMFIYGRSMLTTGKREINERTLELIKQAKQDAETKWNSLDKLKDRSELPILLNKFKYKTMIEIGVMKGEYAMTLLSKWREFEHYYGIDAWEQQKNYADGTNVGNREHMRLYQHTLKTLTERFGKNRITLIRNYSTLALPKFKKDSIDFIYVDARHDYCGSSEDINNYYSVLKCDGLMAGHDFQFDSRPFDQDWSLCANGSRIEGSVKKAVLEFAQQKRIKPIYQTGEKLFPSWYFFKVC
jgi:predicted O-methyltransferase YrrM